jgi:hypothetical protein
MNENLTIVLHKRFFVVIFFIINWFWVFKQQICRIITIIKTINLTNNIVNHNNLPWVLINSILGSNQWATSLSHSHRCSTAHPFIWCQIKWSPNNLWIQICRCLMDSSKISKECRTIWVNRRWWVNQWMEVHLDIAIINQWVTEDHSSSTICKIKCKEISKEVHRFNWHPITCKLNKCRILNRHNIKINSVEHIIFKIWETQIVLLLKWDHQHNSKGVKQSHDKNLAHNLMSFLNNLTPLRLEAVAHPV